VSKQFKTIYAIPDVKKDGYVMTVQPCQEGVHFERDLPIRFEVSLTFEGRPYSEGELYAYFKWNSERVVWHSCALPLADGKATLEFTCEQSGFGNLHVLYYRDGKEVFEQLRGIAISPDQLRRSYPCPEDFDAFWAEKKAALKAISVEATYTRIDGNTHPALHSTTHKSLLEKDLSQVEIFDVQVVCPEKNVSGILSLPLHRRPRSLPAVISLHGAGVRPCDPGRFVEYATKGLMIYEINAHGIPNDQSSEWYADLKEKGELLDYEKIGRDSRDSFYFLNMFLRVQRGLDFLMSREEWDGRTLVVMGGSQGSAQACAGAYLEERVSAIVASIPAYGDLTGFLCGRNVNWFDWLHLGPRGRVSQKILDVAPYFDTVNFLRNYKKEACFCLGLLDQGCLPTTHYVPFSECPAEATVILQSDCYHSVCDEASAMQWEFIIEHSRRTTARHCQHPI
jgi:cephalosporin-C deacetylase-like acetyl esterase